MLYGYARVSTAFESTKDRNQKFDRQEMILKEYGVKQENLFCDRVTGGSSTKDREEYNKLMSILVPGDIIYVTEMSRFSRSTMDLLASVNYLMEHQVGIRFIKEGLEFGTGRSSAIDKLMFTIFGAFNEFEKSLIAERVRQGMQASKSKGTILGRPQKLDKPTQEAMIKDFVEEGMIYDDIVKKYKVSRPTAVSICKPHSMERKDRKIALKRAEKEALKNNLL